jgi:5-methyltetrahydrofolate--homocysteine methyltransferase
MFIIGERFNTSISEISKAVKSRDADFIIDDARAQLDSGASALDINAGTHGRSEQEDVLWLLQTLQDAMDVRISLDSSNVKIIEILLNKYRAGEKPIINSITGEKSKMADLTKLLKDHDSDVIALALDDNGIPDNSKGRLDVVNNLVKSLENEGIEQNRLFVDPLVFPISTDTTKALVTIETLKGIKAAHPDTRAIVGLSNISFGLPKPRLLNRTFLAMLMAHGLDAAILDPTMDGLMSTVCAAEVLINKDEFCGNYIAAHRSKKLVP